MCYNKIGKEGYFTIIGHTPIETSPGYKYEELDNTLNIDGGNAIFSYYNTSYLYKKKNPFQQIEDIIIPIEDYEEETLKELDKYSHTPLVEILDNKLRILTFNNKNEIILGNYFESGVSIPIDNNELDKCRKNLSENEKAKQRVRQVTRGYNGKL